jgi:hypothetical protein
LTEAKRKLNDIEEVINRYSKTEAEIKSNLNHSKIIPIQFMYVNPVTGGISGLKLSNEKSMLTQSIPIQKPTSMRPISIAITMDLEHLPVFAPVYCTGINPTKYCFPTITIPAQSDNDSSQFIQVHGEWNTDIGQMTADWEYRLNKKAGEIEIEVNIEKDSTLEKESLHFLLSTNADAESLTYGTTQLEYPTSQLPGSNREFICSEGSIVLHYADFDWVIESQDLPLIEIGQPIDETQEMGAKVWKREPQSIEQLYLYIFNNYWHTNYKAEQGGPIHFKVKFKLKAK